MLTHGSLIVLWFLLIDLSIRFFIKPGLNGNRPQVLYAASAARPFELTGPDGFATDKRLQLLCRKSSNFLNTAEVAFDIVSCHTPPN